MAGADVEDVAAAVEAQGAGVEGDVGVGAEEGGVVDLLPVLGVADDPEDLHAVVLVGVVLTHYNEVVVAVHPDTAEDGQLQGDGLAGQEIEVLVVIFHHQVAADGLGADILAVLKGEIGVDGVVKTPGIDVVVVVDVVAGGGCGGGGGHGDQADAQHQRQKQGNDAFHGVAPF